MDTHDEAQITHIAQMILDKVPEMNKCSLDEIKVFIKSRLEEIIIHH